MHFKSHEEYLRFVRSTPVEPREYTGDVEKTEPDRETDDGEVLQAD